MTVAEKVSDEVSVGVTDKVAVPVLERLIVTEFVTGGVVVPVTVAE